MIQMANLFSLLKIKTRSYLSSWSINMDIVYTYSHLGGEEILIVRYHKLYKEIMTVIKSIDNPGKNKVSKEKTMQGEQLYSPPELNGLFKERFNKIGWLELTYL